MNKIMLIGRLTSDPELKYTQAGKAFAKFTLAVNRIKKEEADFINCTAWDKTAEIIGEYCRKGHRLAVEGQMKIDIVGQGEERKTYAGVNVQSIEFLESAKTETKKEEVAADDLDRFPFG